MTSFWCLSGVRFGRKRIPIVSYNEWAPHVRSLGIKSSTEYFAWTKSGVRPRNIPPRPDVAYKLSGEWPGWPLALENKRAAAVELSLKPPLLRTRSDFEFRNRFTLTNERAFSWFRNLALARLPHLDFQCAPPHVVPNLFVRRRGEDDNAWAGLHVKAAGGPVKNQTSGGRRKWVYAFSGILRSREMGRIFICEPEKKVRFCRPDEIRMRLRPRSSEFTAQVRVALIDGHRVPAKSGFDACDHLASVLGDLPRRSIEAWASFTGAAQMRKRYCTMQVYLRASALLATVLYRPAGIEHAFRGASGDAHNMLLGQMRCVQRLTYRGVMRSGVPGNCVGSLSRRILGDDMKKRELPYYVGDQVDFFIYILRTNENTESSLSGVYILPKQVLQQHGYLADIDAEKRGRKSLVLYPPGENLRKAKRKLDFANAQQEFFIDLKGKERGSADDIAKLQKILKMYSVTRKVPSN